MTDDDLQFARVPQLELDQLLTQLIVRARDVQNVQSRLRGLLKANEAIMGHLELPVVLREIIMAACELVEARYGALGVIGPDGGLEQFVHYGVDTETAAAIGHLPTGKGLLGALIDDPRPIRLHRISDDPRSVGFPANHPPMGNFLGVPIRVRNEVFGNLYLAERQHGEFTVDDEELVKALASSAAIAIENARLYDEARTRQRWLQASTDITRQLLSESGEDPLVLIARNVQEISDADVVTVVLPVADTGRLMVEVATGLGADRLTAMSYSAERTLAGSVIATGEPILIDDIAQRPDYTLHLLEVVPAGPTMALPLAGVSGTRGALLAVRLTGRRSFTGGELEMATTFANHAAIALELADSRADQQRVVLLEDRDRIARDLHDHVIQRLFAAGLSVQSVQAGVHNVEAGRRLARVVDDLDSTIRQIRTSIFALRGRLSPNTSALRAELLQVIAQQSVPLGFEPTLTFAGPIDTITDAELTADVLAVAREAVSNVARHARASRVEVALLIDGDRLRLDVRDDGIGIGEPVRRSGLANLAERASQHGGKLEVTGEDGGGTHLRWEIALR